MENENLNKEIKKVESEFDLSSIIGQEMLSTFAPQIANFVPVIEKKIKDYLKEKNCIIIVACMHKS